MSLTRRTFLATACSAAAAPLATPVVFADLPGENRLVVLVLRGGMDGLGVIQPYGDPAFAGMRPVLADTEASGLQDLDGFFGLAPRFAELMPMWRAGELAFVQAVSTPYRNKRSHFDGQDFLENGGNHHDGRMTSSRDGWLNRAIAQIPGARTDFAISVGNDRMMLLSGDAPSASWSPTNRMNLRDGERRVLSMLYANDPLFAQAFAKADMLSQDDPHDDRRGNQIARLARYAASRLNGPARIAAFSLTGWDTHRRQDQVMHRPAVQTVTALTTLKAELGRNWDRTMVLGITEFGRTARENGSRGTDHGTGGAMFMAGGAVRGGKVFGQWPGLGESDLYQGRDLMPTDDLRRWCAWPLAALFGLDRSRIEQSVFPGLDMGRDPGMIA